MNSILLSGFVGGNIDFFFFFYFYVPVYSAPRTHTHKTRTHKHTHNQELHTRPHLRRFYHNNT